MPITLAFDVYGTLIDTAGVIDALSAHAGDRAPEFSRTWRDKQLEYSFRRGLMRRYRDFSVCTRNALDYTCRLLNTDIPEADRQRLMQVYRVLPAFPEVEESLSMLRSSNCRMFAFSNGLAEHVRGLLEHSRIDGYFQDVVSVDEINSFKPDPAVYEHFLARAESDPDQTWLISGNPFDVIGALSTGMRAVWVRRAPHTPFDPWEFEPTKTISDLKDLVELFSNTRI